MVDDRVSRQGLKINIVREKMTKLLSSKMYENIVKRRM